MSQNTVEIKPTTRNFNDEVGCQFTGTCEYFRWSYLFPWAYLTDGTKHIAQTLECFWFFDVIASYQMHPDVHKEPLQFWSIEVKDNRAIIRVERDTDQPMLHQVIEYCSFPDGILRVWGSRSIFDGKTIFVLYLPSEH